MNATALLAVLAAIAATASAQNAPAVVWANVRPIHTVPQFFEDYPFLQRLHERHSPLTSYLEGTAATANQFPYQAALVINRSNTLIYCGGSLISNQFVLTAGHCLDSASGGTAILGANRVRNPTEAGQLRVAVNQFFTHPGWNGLRLADDVGLVRLPTAVTFTASIAAIRLSNYRQLPTSYLQQQAILTGHGRGVFAPPAYDVGVRWSFFRVVSHTECNLRQPDVNLETSQFCAELLNGRQCPGDSGSPLTVIEADGRPTQIGVASFVTGLGCSQRPAIFTRLNFYLRWIQQTTAINVANDFTF